MILRKLILSDADKMLKWMNDENVVTYFLKPFKTFKKKQVIDFIHNSFTDENLHFAISDDGDDYLGTVSLKK